MPAPGPFSLLFNVHWVLLGKPHLSPTWPRPGQSEHPALKIQEPFAGFYPRGKPGLTVEAGVEDAQGNTF